ncbi:hypothetical protein [Pseudomonas phage SAM2]|nr:hypothetical protein [Pseudomonas phage SAM2]
MSYAMFDFQMIEERNTASMEVEPGSFYVGFSFGRYGLLSLTFIDGEWADEITPWIPEPKREMA